MPPAGSLIERVTPPGSLPDVVPPRAVLWAALLVVSSVAACASESADGGGGGAAPTCSSEGELRDCYPGEPSTLGLGPCRAGTSSCHDGTWGECEGAVLPTAESCNGQDDDCNGVVDEGCGCEDGDERACYGGPPSTQAVGGCRDGVQRCADSVWEEICEGQTLPSPELCDTLDNDCNGVVDELECACTVGQTQACYAGSAATLGVGPCEGGVQSCVDGAWSAVCEGDVIPTAETCNGTDDDCDGAVDDGDPESGAGCTTGLPGPCSDGVRHCLGGELSCVASTQPTSEDCDNAVDDDCDGDADCGEDDDCDGEIGPPSLAGSSVCRASLPTCNNSVACSTCYYTAGEHRWCRRVHGSWQWIPAWACEAAELCEASCCAGTDLWCDGNGSWLNGIAPEATCPGVPASWYCP